MCLDKGARQHRICQILLPHDVPCATLFQHKLFTVHAVWLQTTFHALSQNSWGIGNKTNTDRCGPADFIFQNTQRFIQAHNHKIACSRTH
jgi:hypothetical protein